MNKEQIPDGFKLSLNEKEVYTYEKSSDKWKLGRRDATKEELSMIEFIIKQIDPPAAEQVKSADVDITASGEQLKPAEIVKSGKTLPKPSKQVATEAQKAETPRSSDESISKKELLKTLKSERLETKEKKTQAKPESLIDEQKRSKAPILVKIQNVSDVARAIVDTLQKSVKTGALPPPTPTSEPPKVQPEGALRSSFNERMREKNPWLRFFTDMFETPEARAKGKTPKRSLFGRVYGGTSPQGPSDDGQRRMAEKLGTNKAKPSDFTPKYGSRTELNRLTDLTEGEKELLARRGVAPASERDFSYRRDGKPLSKAQLLEELDLAHEEGPLKSGFKQKMREKNPWLRFFTNRMERPEDVAAGKTPKMSITGTKTFKSAKAGVANVAQKIKSSGVFKKAAGATSKVASKVTGKTAAKGLGKSLLKKIPGVGLVTGLALGAGRLMQGDLTGAIGEVASGAASTVPGIGTAASTAIDVGLAARDMNAEQEKDQPEMFAKGGVVERATPFKHAGGTGVMGEAGPEAIMPLKRDSSGNLGVSAEPVSKDALTNQTTSLKQTDEELKKREVATQQQSPAPTIINSSTTNNTMGGGGGESRSPTASPRGSLATNYFSF